MLDTSIAGRGQLKARSINVEANLLSQRLTERARLAEQIRKRMLALGFVLFIGCIAIPVLANWSDARSSQLVKSEIRKNELGSQVGLLTKQQESKQPLLLEADLRGKLTGYASGYYSRLAEFFNASKPDMVLSQAHIEITNSELKVTAKGAAESYEAYEGLLGRLQKAGGSGSVIPKGFRGSAELGENGVAFDLVYKVKVSGQ